MSPRKTADVRYYIDADILGLARVLTGLRSDVTYPGDPGGTIKGRTRPPCPLTTPHLRDDEWIPEIGRRGWVALTRDRAIADHRSLLNAVRDSGAKLVAFVGTEAVDTWAQLEVLMTRWRDFEKLRDEPGPFVYTMTRTTLKPLSLG